MLEELRIENFAIIDRLELHFTSGLNVITGETGAGKSIIIDAVELLLGAKPDSSFVRAGAERALVEGSFSLDSATQAQILPILQREQMEGESPDFVTLTREVRSNGRSAARVNGVTASGELLRELGALLVDVHGQSEHLSLLDPRSHLGLLDRYAELVEMRLAMGALVEKAHGVRREIERLTADEAALKKRAEQLAHEVEEIETAALEAGEDDDLKAEATRMGNSEHLAKLTAEAYALLHGDDVSEQMSAVDQLTQISVLLGKLANIDPEMKEESALANDLSEQADDLALALRRYADHVEYNPDRLEEVEERLEFINRLKRRYGGSITAVLEYGAKARAELEAIQNSDERLQALTAEQDKLLHMIGEVAERISKVRQMMGQKMGERVVAELADLKMEKARFEVSTTRKEDKAHGCYIGEKRYAFDHNGVDRVEFLLSANPGEPLRALAKVASGGEMARIMLALKRVLALADQTPTLIFDEIDTGIGGRVGSVVGEKLWALSTTHQVMVVTHLPQLAGYGDKHYHVTKAVRGERTSTLVTALDDEGQRIEELAAMLGAEGETGRMSARQILAQADLFKEETRQAAKLRAKGRDPQPDRKKG